MKITVFLTFIFVAGVLCDGNSYTNKYDDIDLESIITNDRLLKNYVDCLLDRGKCTKDGAELKKHIPDALETQCAKCSEKHRNGIRRVVKYIAENKKDMWNDLVQKYDPDGKYRKQNEQLLKKEQINI